MKNNILKIISKSILLLSVLLHFSCDKEIEERNLQFAQLDPLNPDVNAGTWMPILLTSPNEFAIEVPVATNSSAYASEINEIKSYQANLTDDQKSLIKYWSAGSVLRWNEIMRELVARHNLPPYQNEDGSYPIPSGANPFGYPQFPFSNPPYAARAYAYVSAAQYDALVATWHYKFVYNRAAPYTIDSEIKVLVPKSIIPSYPSEDAVIAGATVEMLKLLFPTEIAFINGKLEEEKLYRIMSGANVRSDVEVGISLGKKVAGKFVQRAKTDGTSQALGNQALWTQLQTQTAATGEIPWISQENPPRPPMLPNFKNVQSFLQTPAMIISNRPIAPPSTNSAQFATELAEVKYYGENYSRDRMRIVTKWADGVGTYTPSGHWNEIASQEFVNLRFSEVRWARNMALLNISMMDAAISCWDAKYTYFNPRPSQVDPTIKTFTGLPNFPAYVSGHSTFSATAATYLSFIIPSKSYDFKEMAKEASNSRLFGAIHYRSDCEQGLILGEKIGNIAISRALIDGAN